MKQAIIDFLTDFGTFVVIASSTAMLILVIMAFFFTPAYEKGVWIGFVMFSNAFSGCLAFKFGITQTKKEEPPKE